MRKKEFLPKLLNYIELANAIPKSFEFPSRTVIERETGVAREDSENYFNSLLDPWKEKLNELPPVIRDYVFACDGPGILGFEEFIENLETLSSIAFALRFLGYMVWEMEDRKDPNKLSLNEYLLGWFDQLPGYMPEPRIRIQVNSEGFIKFRTNEFLDFLLEHDIPADRVRYCFVCSKIFWAFRSDKWTCSSDCGNIARQRTWQKEHREAYNKQRRKNYRYKKLKEKKSEEG